MHEWVRIPLVGNGIYDWNLICSGYAAENCELQYVLKIISYQWSNGVLQIKYVFRSIWQTILLFELYLYTF